MGPAAFLALTTMAVSGQPAREAREEIGTRRGPGRVCMLESSFDLRRGETVRIEHAGLHGLSLTISGPYGTFIYAENEIFGAPRERSQRIRTRAGMKVERYVREGEPAYLFYGPISSYRDRRERPVVWVSGRALGGGRADLAILNRLRTGPVDFSTCTFRYAYGWDEGALSDAEDE